MNKIERGARAKSLLEDVIFKEVQSEIKADIVKKLEEVPVGDIDSQHELVLSLQMLKAHRTRLERWIDDAKIEQKSQEQKSWIEKQKQRFRPRV